MRDGDAPESAYAPVPFTPEAWRDSVDAHLLDLLAHAWDLAKGLGRDFTPSAHLAADFLRMAEAIPDRAYGEGLAFTERLSPDGTDWERGGYGCWAATPAGQWCSDDRVAQVPSTSSRSLMS